MAHRASIIEFNDQGILTPSISEDYSTLLSNNKEVTISPSRDEYIHTSHTRVYNPDLQEVITYSMISLHQLFDSQNENIIYFLDSSKRIMKLDRSAGNISEFFDHRTEYILDAGDQIIAITEGHDFEFTGTLITTLDK